MALKKTGAGLALAMGLAAIGGASPAYAQHAVAQVLSVQVSLSPLARRTLGKAGEQVTVSVAFYGYPSPEGHAHVDEAGQIALAQRKQVLPANGGIARFPLADIPPPRLRWIAGRARIDVNVNVYSARRHFRDNVLACDFVDGRVPRADQMPIALRCGLISEHPKTRAIG